MPWTIYCHIHIDSGRRYIGLTKRTMERRWSQHCVQAKSSKGGRWHFPNAIRQYGPQAFSHEVLEVCETLKAANEAEIKWIDHFNSRDPQFGFNLAPGDSHIPHPIRKNPWDDPEYRKKTIRSLKISHGDPKLRAKKKKISEDLWSNPEFRSKLISISKNSEHRRKISEACKEVSADPRHQSKMRLVYDNPERRAILSSNAKGRITDDSTKQKISESLKRTFSDPAVKARGRLYLRGVPRSEEYKKKRKEYNLKQREIREKTPFTGMDCKHHGFVSADDCFMGKYTDGSRRIECRKCIRERMIKRREKLRIVKEINI
jgi:hypothetical protein